MKRSAISYKALSLLQRELVFIYQCVLFLNSLKQATIEDCSFEVLPGMYNYA